MFVGGEFYYDTRWLCDQPTVETENMLFLNGGKACLIVISEYLLDHGISRILLPSYLCPTIVDTLERCGLACEYYQIQPDFSIDLEDLARKAAGHQAVYFINYFGFLHPPAAREVLSGLRQQGVVVVEDNAQAGFSAHPSGVFAPCGDFAFNSMRKLCAYDGGYLSTPYDVTPYVKKYQGCLNRRLPLIRSYREKLAQYLFQGADCFDELTQLYRLAESCYEADLVVAGDPHERRQIERLDWKAIKQVRRENYAYLLSLISGIDGLRPVFPALPQDTMPLGLPVYLSGGSRDRIFNELGNAGIGLTIHWEEILSDPRLNHNRTAVEMASTILTLVIDQRTSRKQLEYQAQVLADSTRYFVA